MKEPTHNHRKDADEVRPLRGSLPRTGANLCAVGERVKRIHLAQLLRGDDLSLRNDNMQEKETPGGVIQQLQFIFNIQQSGESYASKDLENRD